MLRKYETVNQSRGLMNEVARSVLTSEEFSTFTYYIDQYDQRGLSVDDLATALLELLDTPEKVCLQSSSSSPLLWAGSLPLSLLSCSCWERCAEWCVGPRSTGTAS